MNGAPRASRDAGHRASARATSSSADVAEHLERVGGLPRGDLAAVAEAAAVDLQAAGPGRADADEEDDEQHGGRDRRRPDEHPEQQGEPDGDLDDRQAEGHRARPATPGSSR